ncbi:MAG: GGDEF domain-containing protein [Candidatus Faecalibacterium intestinavium]|uniref:GGDEF domain-containing protein n=1 Tax=Candidatus Faecalibacterium intestinavium TaxID=2838580 RepID=A0A9E2KK08_9FIRM|nr:GGDEF domain-containing protein [Candidatus Faecalibacterium intestinavium]
MHNLPAIFIANGLGAALTLLLVLSNRKHIRNSLLDDRLFFSLCLIGMWMCLMESLTFLADGVDRPAVRALAVASNIMLYMGSAICGMLWVSYVEYKLFGRVPGLRSGLPVPGLIVCGMALLNLFYPIFFSISPDNVYRRQPLSVLPYLVAFGYLLWGGGRVFFYRKKAGKYLFMPAVVFLAPIFVGCLIQSLCYGLSLVWVSMAFGLTSLYINLQNETSMLDSLTRLYNREYLNRYLQYLTQGMMVHRRFSGMMIDINSFKAINDSYGHSEGDAALRKVGQALAETVTEQEVAARYGGDEFVVISKGDEAQIRVLAEQIRGAVRRLVQQDGCPYEITLSIGTAAFDPRLDTADSFLRQMDQNMYREKKRHYSGTPYDRRHTPRQPWPARPEGENR